MDSVNNLYENGIKYAGVHVMKVLVRVFLSDTQQNCAYFKLKYFRCSYNTIVFDQVFLMLELNLKCFEDMHACFICLCNGKKTYII